MQAFDAFFGPAGNSRNHAVCAYTFEPNPIHAPRLREMEAVYTSLGWNMQYFPYAVGHANGSFPLLRENSRFDQAAVLVKNASLFKLSSIGDHNSVRVEVIDLVEFIETHIAKGESRFLREDKDAGRVVIKMDIEGEEYKLLPNLIASGVLCRYVDALYVEYHVRHSRKFLEEKMVPLTKER
jgi:FkbM family methyltransferase